MSKSLPVWLVRIATKKTLKTKTLKTKTLRSQTMLNSNYDAEILSVKKSLNLKNRLHGHYISVPLTSLRFLKKSSI